MSWCGPESWLDDLPIEGAVPMHFRMGSAPKAAVVSPLCLGRRGVSTDEPWPAGPAAAQTWIYSPGPWTRSLLSDVP